MLWKYLRRAWYWCRRKRRKFVKFWNRFKWCLVGGFAYAAGRFAFNYLKDFLNTL